MPRGGFRVGAGRKPDSSIVRFMRNARGATPPDDATRAAGEPTLDSAVSTSPSVEPPPELLPAERVIWDAWAPLAIAARTLIPATVAAFVQLCQLEADRRELRLRLGGAAARPLLALSENELGIRREVRQLAIAVRAGLKDFAIAPFGKEIHASASAPAADDPLNRFTR